MALAKIAKGRRPAAGGTQRALGHRVLFAPLEHDVERLADDSRLRDAATAGRAFETRSLFLGELDDGADHESSMISVKP